MSQVKRPCGVCAADLSAQEQALGLFEHPKCSVPKDVVMEPAPTEPVNPFTPVAPAPVGTCPEPAVAKAVKDEFVEIIMWAEANRGRSLQVHLGPSELGLDCDRQLAYRIMGLSGPNEGKADPWYGFVGSAIHTRTQESVERYEAAHPQAKKWNIEELVIADPLIRGHADYNRGVVLVDLKGAGKSVIDDLKKGRIPQKYRVQGHTYVKGLRDAGRMIEYVVFLFVPRDGKLRDAIPWAERYDETIALEAIARPYRLRDEMVRLDLVNHPERWEQIPAKPDYIGCGYCPLYSKYLPDGIGADDKGCPGYSGKK